MFSSWIFFFVTEMHVQHTMPVTNKSTVFQSNIFVPLKVHENKLNNITEQKPYPSFVQCFLCF